jgi:hypothetical protein
MIASRSAASNGADVTWPCFLLLRPSGWGEAALHLVTTLIRIVPCSRHGERPMGKKPFSPEQREKRRAYHKVWQEAHRAERRAYNKQWREENREQARAQKRRRYAENREQALAGKKRYYQENQDRIKEARRQRYREQKESK